MTSHSVHCITVNLTHVQEICAAFQPWYGQHLSLVAPLNRTASIVSSLMRSCKHGDIGTCGVVKEARQWVLYALSNSMAARLPVFVKLII